MKVSVKSVSDIGQAIRATRISQELDQLTAAQLSNIGQSFLSHLENGKETAQIGKVLQVLASLGIGIELTLPPHIATLQAIQDDTNLVQDDLSVFYNVNSQHSTDKASELLQKLAHMKRVRRG